MARNGSDCSRGVVCGIAEKVQKELGLLAISLEQRAVDCVGTVRPRVRADLAANLSCFSKHQRRGQKQRAVTRKSEPDPKRQFHTGQYD